MKKRLTAAAAPGIGAAAAILSQNGANEFKQITCYINGYISSCDSLNLLTDESISRGYGSRVTYVEKATGQSGPAAIRAMLKDISLRAAGTQTSPGEIARFMLFCAKLRKAIYAGIVTPEEYRNGVYKYIPGNGFINTTEKVISTIPRVFTHIFDRAACVVCPISGFEFDPARAGFWLHMIQPDGSVGYVRAFSELRFNAYAFPAEIRPIYCDDIAEYLLPDCIEPLGLCRCETRGEVVLQTSAHQHSNGLWYQHPEGFATTPERAVENYHSGCKAPAPIRFSRNSKFLVGFEIEKEDLQVKCSVTISDFRDSLPGFRKERDGSLDDEKGFEFITPPFELSPRRIADFFKNNPVALSHVNAEFSRNCGGHIHISCPGKTGPQLFEQMSGYIHLIHALFPHRADSNRYCIAKPAAELHRGAGKYSSFNVLNNRVEIRIFGAVRGLENLIWRAGLLKKITENPCFNSGDFYLNQLPKFICHLKKVYTTAAELEKVIKRIESYTFKFEGIKVGPDDVFATNPERVKLYRPATFRAFLNSKKQSVNS